MAAEVKRECGVHFSAWGWMLRIRHGVTSLIPAYQKKSWDNEQKEWESKYVHCAYVRNNIIHYAEK